MESSRNIMFQYNQANTEVNKDLSFLFISILLLSTKSMKVSNIQSLLLKYRHLPHLTHPKVNAWVYHAYGMIYLDK